MNVIEAMSAGVPVVGSSCGAIPEVLGCDELVFKEDDVGGLARILQRAVADDAFGVDDEGVDGGGRRERVRRHDLMQQIGEEQAELLAGLRAGGDGDAGARALDGRNLDGAAQRRRHHRDRHVAVDVGAVALEDLVRGDRDEDVEIAGRAAARRARRSTRRAQDFSPP